MESPMLTSKIWLLQAFKPWFARTTCSATPNSWFFLSQRLSNDCQSAKIIELFLRMTHMKKLNWNCWLKNFLHWHISNSKVLRISNPTFSWFWTDWSASLFLIAMQLTSTILESSAPNTILDSTQAIDCLSRYTYHEKLSFNWRIF